MGDRKRLFLTNMDENALASLIEAGDRGDGAAACRMGDIYREEVVGLDGSSRLAFLWYSRSALAGDANGQNNLGACYEHGLGCAQSYRKAVKWYRLAQAQGLGTAAMNLGYCYLYGHGVPADKAEALRLFREAVERGEERAAQEVERLERQASPRVSQPVPAGTPLTHPWGLARRVPRRDGPQEQLRHPEAGSAAVDTNTPNVMTLKGSKPQVTASTSGSVRFVDVTQSGKHFGLIGVSGVTPSCGPVPAGSDEANEDKLFPGTDEGRE